MRTLGFLGRQQLSHLFQERPATIARSSAVIAALFTLPVFAPAVAQDGPGLSAGRAEAYELSVPAKSLVEFDNQPMVFAPPRKNPLAGEPGQGHRGTWSRARESADPLIERSQNPASRTPSLDLLVAGATAANACNCTPPDTNGDVGLSHYIQIVNATKVSVYDKSGMLLQRFSLGRLWPSGACRQNLGDPNVRYDEAADRWLLSQFNQTSDAGPFFLCFAISQTSDPTGAYHLYRFKVPKFPDYFKVGVWPAIDVTHAAYYVGTNESSYTAYAFDRTKMLLGDSSASFVRFPGETNFLMPADANGFLRPTGGGLFYTFKDNAFHDVAQDRLELFQLTPDFVSPANSTFRRIKQIPIAPFRYTVCGFFHVGCIPQRGTKQKIDAVSEWPMQTLAYRKFPDHESMVGNFTVGNGTATPGAAIRWFELRKAGSGWTLFQEGTLDRNDGHNRFMGSIAMDQDGNIALGYSVSSNTLFPGVRYVTRQASDPPGTMGAEKILKNGGGSQTGSNRWGDYSGMAVDPATGCQFWYTNEYYATNSAADWKTIIGAFTMPGCAAAVAAR
jgi:hypothetical protein